MKGHRSRPEVLIAVLQMLLRIDAIIGILLLDKRHAIAMKEQWPDPNKLRHHTAIYLTDLFIEKTPIYNLYCDEDIRGKQEIRNFRTDILRCNQCGYPGRKMKVALWPSHKSTLIQCADIVTYVAARSLRPDGLTPELRRLWQVLLQNPRMIYVLMDNWGE